MAWRRPQALEEGIGIGIAIAGRINDYSTQMSGEWAATLSESVTATCALAGVVIAALGLRTWRQELRGRVEYDLARRVMILVYKVRDGLEYVQYPMVFSSEWQSRPGRDNSRVESDLEDRRYAYNMRLQPVNDARRSLQVELLEVEAIWGNVLKQASLRLSEVYADLAVAVMNYLNTQCKQERCMYSDEEVDRLYRTVVNVGEPGAKFRRELNEAVETFERLLRPHLRRGPRATSAVAVAARVRIREMFTRLRREWRK